VDKTDMLRQTVRQYLPLALVVTALCGLAYLLTSRCCGLGANEPQIQMAQEAAARLSAASRWPMS
jgi:hypothetical protein